MSSQSDRLNGPYVVMVGSINNGYKCYGPFPDLWAANSWRMTAGLDLADGEDGAHVVPTYPGKSTDKPISLLVSDLADALANLMDSEGGEPRENDEDSKATWDVANKVLTEVKNLGWTV